MSCKEMIPSRRIFLITFEEHIFAVMREIVLLIFYTNVSKFLQANVWKNEKLPPGISLANPASYAGYLPQI